MYNPKGGECSLVYVFAINIRPFQGLNTFGIAYFCLSIKKEKGSKNTPFSYIKCLNELGFVIQEELLLYDNNMYPLANLYLHNLFDSPQK